MTDVLVVDDEPLIGRLVEVALGGAGVRVTTATTAGMGVALALEQRPDVILLDLQLPDADGELVLDALRRAEGWDPRVVIFSALDEARVRAVAARHGAGWLPKPFDLDALRSVLAVARSAA